MKSLLSYLTLSCLKPCEKHERYNCQPVNVVRLLMNTCIGEPVKSNILTCIVFCRDVRLALASANHTRTVRDLQARSRCVFFEVRLPHWAVQSEHRTVPLLRPAGNKQVR